MGGGGGGGGGGGRGSKQFDAYYLAVCSLVDA